MKTVALDELCEINVGRTPARAEPAFWGTGHRWLSIADMNQGHAITRTKEQITDAGANAGKVVAPGTVVLSFKLSIGKVGITEVPLYTNEAIAALPVKDLSALDTRYLMRSLEAMDLASSSNRAAMGATLNKRSLAQIRVPLPPLFEQRRIAAILDQADTLRAKRRQVLAHLGSLTQSVFHDMFSSGAFDSVAAGDFMPRMRNGVSPSSAGTYSATVLTLSAVTQGEFNPGATKPGAFAVEPPADKRVSANDFLMCRGNGNKTLVGVGTYSHKGRPDLVFPDTVIAGAVDDSRINIAYLDAAWKQRGTRGQIESVARTTNGTYKVNQKALSEVRIPLPPLDLQQQFAECIQRVDAQRAAIQRALATDDELFASLQSRAFRGEL